MEDKLWRLAQPLLAFCVMTGCEVKTKRLNETGENMNWLGYGLLSALFAGLVAIFGKIGVQNVDATLATTARAIIMAAALMGLMFARRGSIDELRNISASAWFFITLAGLAGAASWLCYFRALQMGDASRVAPIDRLSVVVTIALATLFLGERPSAGGVLGVLLICAGSVLVALK
jgi:bacterial/archaeal transporter family protein